MSLYTPRFRVSFPHVFEPKLNELSGQQQYSLVALFDPGEDLSELAKAAKEAIDKKWPNPATRPKNLRTPFRKQDEKEKEGVLPEGMQAGGIFLNLTSKMKPGVVSTKLDPKTGKCAPILNPEDFYAGCYAIATVTVYAYDQKGNRGVAFGLQNLQKVGEGEPLAGRPKAESEFRPIAGAQAGEKKEEPSAPGGFSAEDLFR